MTEPETGQAGAASGSGGSNWLAGCAIAAGIAAVVLLIVVVLAVVGGVVFVRNQQRKVERLLAQMPPVAAPDSVEGGAGDGAAGPGDAGEAPAEPGFFQVIVKLAGATPRGVKYVMTEEDENGDEVERTYVGDEALVAALKKLAAGDPQDPDDDVKLVVDLDVATAAGITQAQVDAAARACWAAGAAVLPPPDLSKEKPPAEAPAPKAKPAPPAPSAPAPPGDKPKEAVL